jgi:hypothetical protein
MMKRFTLVVLVLGIIAVGLIAFEAFIWLLVWLGVVA